MEDSVETTTALSPDLLTAWTSSPVALLVAGALLLLAVVGAVGLVVRSARQRERRLSDRFQVLASEALSRNADGFLTLAAERFRSLQDSASADLDGRQQAIEAVVAPLKEALSTYQEQAHRLDREQASTTTALRDQLESLAGQTLRLENALRSPGARGRWGELTLRRTAELAGLSDHCDFAEQVTLRGDGGGSRPDMVVRLPAGREVVVDSKVPLDAYLEAAEATDEEARSACLAQHAKHLRRHVETLASRGYQAQLERSPDFVVLFLPDDGFLAGAARHDKELLEHALSRGVVIATPTTLYALLSAVAQGWREERVAESTRQILALAKELDERLGTFTDHLGKVGTALGRAVESYNSAVGSFETRLLPQARQMRELGVEGNKALETIPVRTEVRSIRGSESLKSA
jgi:DNA recombination protein RmuC